jgi:protocatechuate 3,4-dioxygenase beta subunit
MEVGIQVRDDRFARQDLKIEPQAEGYPSGLVFALKPAHVIEGRVTYADSGRPVPRARLAVMGGRYINGEADAEGRFRLNPYADSPYKSDATGDPLFSVFAYPPDGQPYLGLDRDLGWPKGAVRQTVEFALPPATLVRGRVTDATSGKPLAGVQVVYMPRNEARPAEEQGRRILTGEWSAAVSGDDGAYAIAIPPGAGHLVARGPSPEYILAEFGSNTIDYGRPGGIRKYAQAVIPVEAPRGSGTLDVAIALRHGITRRGRVLDPDGQPVAAATLITRFNVSDEAHRWGGDKIPVRDGRFVLPGLQEGQAYRVLVIDSKQRRGAAVEISARESGDEPVIRLAPCGSVRVRLVDEAGKPVVRYRLVLEFLVIPGRFQCEFDGNFRGEDLAACAGQALLGYGGHWGGPPTDADGRVTLSGLIPGATYRLLTSEHDAVSLDSEILEDFRVEPGQVLDLPEFTIKGVRAED